MVLRFDIAITETTKNCPTAVLFSLDMCRVKTHKHVWIFSICVAFLCFGATILWTERKYIRNVTQIEFVQTSFCVFFKECRAKTKPRLDNSSLSR